MPSPPLFRAANYAAGFTPDPLGHPSDLARWCRYGRSRDATSFRFRTHTHTSMGLLLALRARHRLPVLAHSRDIQLFTNDYTWYPIMRFHSARFVAAASGLLSSNIYYARLRLDAPGCVSGYTAAP